MKVKDIIALLGIMKNKKSNPYEVKAYTNLIKRIQNFYEKSHELEREDIEKLPITEHMKSKLLILSGLNGNEYIPREFIDRFKGKLCSVVTGQYEKLIITGSYRRNTKFSNDIDIVVLNPTNKFWDILKSKFKLICLIDGEMLKRYIMSVGTKNVRLDFFLCGDKQTFLATILYSTGSSAFNIKMRLLAKKKGMKLNRTGLYKNHDRLVMKSERDFFDALSMKYVEPSER